MSSLPWYVVHGDVVWLSVVAAAVAVALVWLWLRPRRSTRRASRSELARMGSPVALEEAREGQLVALSGVLGVDGDETRGFDDGGPVAAMTAGPSSLSEVLGAMSVSRCGEGLFLDAAGVRVGIEGAVDVRVGSREVHLGVPFRRARRKLRSTLARQDGMAYAGIERVHGALRALQAGDRVRAHGFLRRAAPTSTDEGYRSDGGGWVLAAEPDPDAPANRERVVALAFEGAPRVRGPSIRGLLLRAAATAVVGVVALALVGWVLLAFVPDVPHGPPDAPCAELEPLRAVRVVAVLPFFRSTALARWARVLGRSCDRSEDLVRRQAHLLALSGDCSWGALMLEEVGEVERAIEMARRCSDRGHVLESATGVLFGLGGFEAGSELVGRHSSEVQAAAEPRRAIVFHVLAGEPDRARQVAAARTRQLAERAGRVQEYDRASADVMTANFQCLELALAARSGEAEAVRRLSELAAGAPERSGCPVLAAELVEGEDRLALLRETGPMPGPYGRPAELLLLEAELEADPPEPSWSLRTSSLSVSPASLIEARNMDFALFTGLDKALLERLEAEEPGDASALRIRADLRARASIFELFAGDDEAARRLAAAALEDVDALGPDGSVRRGGASWHELALARLAVIETVAGAHDRAAAHHRQLDEEGAPEPVRAPVVALLALAERGDGRPMGQLLALLRHSERSSSFWEGLGPGSSALCSEGTPPPSGSLPYPMPPVWARRVGDRRAEVASCLRFQGSATRYVPQDSLGNSLFAAAWSWRLATELGEEGWAAELAPARDRLRRALLDRSAMGTLATLGAL